MRRVFLGNFKRFWEKLVRIGARVGAQIKHRDGNTSASRAEVGEVTALRQKLDGSFHKDLGVGAGNETVGGHPIGLAVKVPLAENVLERFARYASRYGIRKLRMGQGTVGIGHKAGARDLAKSIGKNGCFARGILHATLI